MVSRQAGHFFFEPKDYDVVNQATHDHKEAIKVGYNLKRKTVLLSIWALSPVLLWIDPTGFGVFPATAPERFPAAHGADVAGHRTRGACCSARRSCSSSRTCRPGLVWITKIITDPFHDIMLYYRAPWHLLRGELIDPMGLT